MGGSLNMRAIYIHTLADCASSIGLLVGGIIVMATGDNKWDGIMAISIAALVLINTVWVLYPAARVLRQGPELPGEDSTKDDNDLRRSGRSNADEGAHRKEEENPCSVQDGEDGTAGENRMGAEVKIEPLKKEV